MSDQLKQAAQQALEALKSVQDHKPNNETNAAITALRTALEQPEQEPSQWRDMVVVNLVREGINKHKARDLADHFTTPPAAQRPWVGLTDEEIVEIAKQTKSAEPGRDGYILPVSFARAVEAKLKERNNG